MNAPLRQRIPSRLPFDTNRVETNSLTLSRPSAAGLTDGRGLRQFLLQFVSFSSSLTSRLSINCWTVCFLDSGHFPLPLVAIDHRLIANHLNFFHLLPDHFTNYIRWKRPSPMLIMSQTVELPCQRRVFLSAFSSSLSVCCLLRSLVEHLQHQSRSPSVRSWTICSFDFRSSSDSISYSFTCVASTNAYVLRWVRSFHGHISSLVVSTRQCSLEMENVNDHLRLFPSHLPVRSQLLSLLLIDWQWSRAKDKVWEVPFVYSFSSRINRTKRRGNNAIARGSECEEKEQTSNVRECRHIGRCL